MNKSDILLLMEYNFWANRRILNAAMQTTHEQLTQKTTLSFETVLGTLVHAMSAEWVWRQRFQHGASPAAPLSADNFPTLEMVRDRWEIEEAEMRAYLANVDEADLNKTLHYENMQGAAKENILWHLLYHVTNHGMQHRAEVAHVLTQFGHSPGELDFTVFLNEYNARGQTA